MTLLASHLEQISLSSKSISQLEFPPAKIFTNALLGAHEITTLIRDTEPHERALFSIDPNAVGGLSRNASARHTGGDNGPHGRKSILPTAQPVKQSAITRLLGNDMLREIRHSTNTTARSQGGVNVEILLQGAEKLCEVYSVAGVSEKIRTLRKRYREVTASLASLDDKVVKQQFLLERRNKGLGAGENDDEDEVELNTHAEATTTFMVEDFQAEEEEIRELEARKKNLEARVSGIERDLGGLR